MKATSLTDVENRLRHFQKSLEDLGPRLDRAKKQAEFVQKDYEGKLGDYLNEPENARRLFDATNATDSERPARAKHLAQLVSRLEQHEMMPHVLASYEIRAHSRRLLPAGSLAAASQGPGVRAKRPSGSEEILKQVPAKRLTMKPLEDLSKRIRR